MRLQGHGDLKLISEILCVNYRTLLKKSTMSDFPDIKATVAGVRLYEVSEVAHYMSVPLQSR